MASYKNTRLVTKEELQSIQFLARLIILSSPVVDEYTRQCRYFTKNRAPDQNAMQRIKQGQAIYFTKESSSIYIYSKYNKMEISDKLGLFSEKVPDLPLVFDFANQCIFKQLIDSSWNNAVNHVSNTPQGLVYDSQESFEVINVVRLKHLHERLLNFQHAGEIDKIIRWTNYYYYNKKVVITHDYQFPPHIVWNLLVNIRLLAYADSEKLLEFRQQFQKYSQFIYDSGKEANNWHLMHWEA